VGRILLTRYGEQEWIWQIMDAVRAAVTNGVTRFSLAQLPATNATPDGHYQFAARSREEILASQQEAASAGAVNPRSPFERLQDPAKQFEDPVVAPQNEPKRVETKVDEGWVL
jgi:hypothetical protein